MFSLFFSFFRLNIVVTFFLINFNNFIIIIFMQAIKSTKSILILLKISKNYLTIIFQANISYYKHFFKKS